ncbi:exosortase A [Congregibacter litoralis]|uniref:Exosortase A n=1 Tax=Congregibacter litoralis KT71 TaxID=314285 RepID=A4A569_9GAMM|nr:exosortase A [Congregibacter litoralis]EAQ98940.2 exosortase A [Congregibacter litoralis KT71]
MLKHFLADWRSIPQLKALLLILLVVPTVFFSTTQSMINIWLVNETFTHGFLILPIALWLIWEQRHRIASIAVHKDLRATLVVLPILGLWVLATLIDVAVVRQLAMVALIPASVWLILGAPIALALLFPLLYLFFAVPLGQSLIPPMMELTADMTVYLVQHSGVPIYRDGLSFELPSGSWAVVEECSGVRYLIASAALGTIYAYISYRSFSKRALFILASLIVPIVANGFRAYGIVMIGHLSGMKYAVGADHLLYGWVFFGIVIFALFWIGGFWADHIKKDETEKLDSSSIQTPPSALFGMGVIAVMLATNLAVTTLKSQQAALPTNASLILPLRAGNWQATDLAPSGWAPMINNPDLAGQRTYIRGDEQVTLHVGYFHTQRDGAEAISSLNRLTSPYDGAWKLTASRAHKTSVGSIIESEVSLGQDKVFVWSGYLVGDTFVANSYMAKLYQALALLHGQQQAAYITISTDFDAPLEQLRGRLDSWWSVIHKSDQGAILALKNEG